MEHPVGWRRSGGPAESLGVMRQDDSVAISGGLGLPVVAALTLGFGLGMFIDGIVLHQLLQWHHMVSDFESTKNVGGLETNTTWDGVFHLSAWVVTSVGAFLLWRSRGTQE